MLYTRETFTMRYTMCAFAFMALVSLGRADKDIPVCPRGLPIHAQNWDSPSVFDDLSVREMNAIEKYMRGLASFGIQSFSTAKPNSTFIMFMERLPARKSDVLLYMDQKRRAPRRFAKVVLVRGDVTKPVVEEFKVGYLPNPNFHEFIRYPKFKHPIPYAARVPYNTVELSALNRVLSAAVGRVEKAFTESTGGYTYSERCGKRCLDVLPSGQVYTRNEKRSLWVYFVRRVEGAYLHPVGIQMYVNMQGTNSDQWKVEKIWYNDQVYKFEEFVTRYKSDTVDKFRTYVPTDNKNLYSSLHRRGHPVPDTPRRGPHSFMPDGRRFRLDGHHVQWLGWSIHYNIHSSSGPEIYDVRFKDQRILYQMGMQEVMVHYSGMSPVAMHQIYFDSGLFLGGMTNPLIPKVDCPDDAVYLDFAHYMNGIPRLYKNSACVFEHKDSVPLHRHYDSNLNGGYYFAHGMSDNYLILRTVLTVVNYDYIVDYIFRQNGAIETKISLSGYVAATRYVGKTDDQYSPQVAPGVAANMHVHFVNFKVDMDILGEKNRFATLNINRVEKNDPYHQGNDVTMNSFERVLKSRELDAAYKYDFDAPKYLLFYNEEKRNRYSNHRAYRLLNVNMAKSVIPERYTWENGATWIRYQVAVTRRRDSEPTISSPYHFFQSNDPIVTLQKFIDDNEDITDEDLVAWVTLGSHHIPHSEDVPLTATTGMQLQFFLLPYNYFDEDPSMASRDNVRMDPRGPSNKLDFSGNKVNVDCVPISAYGDPTEVRMLRAGTSTVRAVTWVTVVMLSVCLQFL